LFSEEELNAASNLRGIPEPVNNTIHQSAIQREWNEFWRRYPEATRQQVLEHAAWIDQQYDLDNLAYQYYLDSDAPSD
jgi:hypothetical protein